MNGSKSERKPKRARDLVQSAGHGAPQTHSPSALSVAHEELRVANKKLGEKTRALVGANLHIDADRRRLQDLFELAPDGYLVTDKFGAILEANRAALQLLNWPPAMLSKSPLPMFVCLEDRPAFRKKLATLTKTPIIETLEVRLKPFRLDTQIPVTLRVAAIQDEQLRVVGLRWIVRDMTETIKLLAALRHSEALLDRRKRE